MSQNYYSICVECGQTTQVVRDGGKFCFIRHLIQKWDESTSTYYHTRCSNTGFETSNPVFYGEKSNPITEREMLQKRGIVGESCPKCGINVRMLCPDAIYCPLCGFDLREKLEDKAQSQTYTRCDCGEEVETINDIIQPHYNSYGFSCTAGIPGEGNVADSKKVYTRDCQNNILRNLQSIFGNSLQLTGSRYFDVPIAGSDWDFMLLDYFDGNKMSFLNLRGLEDLGFEKQEPGTYADKVTKEVWRHPFGIDIQILDQEGFEKKKKIQQKMKENCLYTRDKMLARDIWNVCLSLLE